jgi:hypothetical protein
VRTMRKLLVAATLCLALSAGVAGPTGATGGDYEQGSPAACLSQIDRRVKDVDKLLARVAGAPDVTDGHRATLTVALQGARAGLVALRAEVVGLVTASAGTATLTPQHEEAATETETEPMSPEVAAACARMYSEFRIYVLRKPQVNLVLAADRVGRQQALFDLLASELEAAIAAVPSDPDVAEAQRLLDDYRAKISAALLGAAGVSDAVIGFGPQDWNENHAILGPYVDVMRQVKRDLRAAKHDAKQIVALLGGATTEGGKTPGKV